MKFQKRVLKELIKIKWKWLGKSNRKFYVTNKRSSITKLKHIIKLQWFKQYGPNAK